MIVQLCAGGLLIICDLKSKAMPLHLPLLIIEGTFDLDHHLKQIDRHHRILPRLFFVYHLNIFKTGSDFLMLTRKLF